MRQAHSEPLLRPRRSSSLFDREQHSGSEQVHVLECFTNAYAGCIVACRVRLSEVFSIQAALNRMPIGLHPGAAKFYKEKGVLK